MCGIAGFLNFNNQPPSQPLLKKMTDCIAHRGPDDEGMVIDQQVALGSRRLAIIDVSPDGHMPMWNQDKTVCLTYNGEIYNYKKLKKHLQDKNYRFKSKSDTEVIIHLYEEYGVEALKKLEGIFALALWDKKKQLLLIARDRLGIKPLHYFCNDHVFIFASEIKAILLHPEVKKEINPKAISHYFSLGFGCIASPETIFRDIYKLPPASYLKINCSDKSRPVTTEQYWKLNVETQNIASQTFEQAALTLKNKIEHSVQSQLVADVPVGTFLSGGLDSSLITAFAQKYSHHQLKTFSIGFNDENFDESPYAYQVAKELKTDHHHFTFSTQKMVSLIPEVIEKLDEPLGDASILPTYLLSRETRKEVTVALSGDGGDELFAGYPTYIAHQIASYINLLPKSVINTLQTKTGSLSSLLQYLPIASHAPNISINEKLNRFLSALDADTAAQHLNFIGPLNLSLKNQLILNHKETALPYAQNILNFIKKQSKADNQKQLQYLDTLIYLSENCLVKTDRASSFNSLEVRVPFLDTEVVEFAFSLPSSYHFSNFQLKRLLKAAAKDILPENIINRSKHGFGIPTSDWLKTDLKKQLDEVTSQKFLSQQGLFNHTFVNQLIQDHFSGKNNNGRALWALYIFQLWWERWMK